MVIAPEKASNQSASLVSVRNIRKTFRENVAVADVSFDIYPGEIFGLLGPNGAGKTTSIRVLLGLFAPEGGSVTFRGKPLTPQMSNQIGYMPEERGLYPDMRVLDCLVYLGTLKGLSKKEARSRAVTYLERLDLLDQKRTKIEKLSRGMEQKVQVIAAVQHEPDLLIIDEPFANLDPINAQLVREIILEMRAKGKSVIMTSHQLAHVEALCDRIALIDLGRVVLYGPLSEIRQQFARDTIQVRGNGVLNGNIPGVLQVESLAAGNWRLTLEPGILPNTVLQALTSLPDFLVDRFEMDVPTLDEIFLQVVKRQQR